MVMSNRLRVLLNVSTNHENFLLIFQNRLSKHKAQLYHVWETGSVTSRPRNRRRHNVGYKVQPKDVLVYDLAHPESSTKIISENCGLSKSHVWTILNESGAHPYRSTPVQGLLPRDAERHYTWCNVVMNNLEDHPTFLADIIWTDKACFRVTECSIDRTFILGSLEIPRYAVEVGIQLYWSINVWSGIFNERFNGPVFYKGTLMGQRYLDLLQDVITDIVESLSLHQL
ncbi:hypothetical protein AVEN_261523-1 [Araneus ventricosus]|uniref:Uncharacterized protein n=1 Tax=Araneus ventricosus TaxID=182803 RepID=A0A4Y2QFU3_ARAVE|nr:hypothetical protein AVEN_261523-1 [Araneus ventricosus]